MAKAKRQFVTLKTTQGQIIVELFPEIAPKTVENFTTHVANGYYNGIIFHRIIEGFMIQGGDPTGSGRGGESIWGRPFEDEFHEDFEFDVPGLLAMANAGPGTNGSQFFITTVPTPWLNNRHTIFGKVVDGMDIVTKLEKVETGYGDQPVEKQEIIQALIRKTPPRKKRNKYTLQIPNLDNRVGDLLFLSVFLYSENPCCKSSALIL